MQRRLESSCYWRGLARLLDRTQTLLRERSRVGVLAKENLLVAERVLLLDVAALSAGLALGRTEDSLDFGAVDETGKIGLRDNVGGEEEALLAVVDGIQLLDGGRGPDDEATEVATGGELEEVERVDRAGLNTGEVAEALNKILAIGLSAVDNERATALAVAAASELALASTELLGLLDLLNIGTSTNSLQEAEGTSGLLSSGESGRVDNEGNLGDGGDLVATGHQERSDSGGGKSRGSSEAPVDIPLEIAQPARPYIASTYFWPWLTLTCHFLQILVGANMRPERHMLPKAA